MTIERFLEVVLTYMPRATRKEAALICAELTAHLADSVEAWTAAGSAPEIAQAKAVEAMGDPKEIGKALDAQFSPFWLWLGRCAKAVCAIAALGVVYGLICRAFPPFGEWVREFLWEVRM